MSEREWTGSVERLPEAMRLLADQCAELANQRVSTNSPLDASDALELGRALDDVNTFVMHEVSTLREWADAIEQLYMLKAEGVQEYVAVRVILAGKQDPTTTPCSHYFHYECVTVNRAVELALERCAALCIQWAKMEVRLDISLLSPVVRTLTDGGA